MRRQPSLVRCFVGLCFGCAVSLVALEWRNPFSDAIVTPDNLMVVRDNIKLSSANASSGAAAQAAELPDLTADGSKSNGFWSKALPFNQQGQPQPNASIESPIRLVLSLDGRYLDVIRPGKANIRFDVAVGHEDWQTPTGSFAIMSKIENPAWQHPITKEEIPPGPDNPLGDRWIGFWSNGEAQIGFHGTNQEELIGEAVSHGCVRMRNRDVRHLYKLVNIGTSVEVMQEASL